MFHRVGGVLVTVLVANGAAAQTAPLPARAAPTPPQVGSFIPASQLLDWCKGATEGDARSCMAYIRGVEDLSGSTSLGPSKGLIDVPMDNNPNEPIRVVVSFLQDMDRSLMSSPASDAVYKALVAKYPYKPAR